MKTPVAAAAAAAQPPTVRRSCHPRPDPPRLWPCGLPRTLPHRHGLGPPPAGPCRVTAATAAVCDLQPPWGGPHMCLCSH